ncbi:MAG: 2-hydroxyacid dehydrogenase, partial [Chromatocurvus sp.]
MRVAFFSSKPYDEAFFNRANAPYGFDFRFLQPHLDRHTAALAEGADAVCAFVNDRLDADALSVLHGLGVDLVALRCAGFNQVDLAQADALGIRVVRVPAYSPHAVAEHTLALLLALNRRIHRAHNRVREGNFSLDGLMGVDIHGLTAGVVGAGRIGLNVVRILRGFGCDVLVHDARSVPEVAALGAQQVPLPRIWTEANIITLHCPLTPETFHMVDARVVEHMKPGVMLINTSRGALIDTRAVIAGLKSERIGALGLDVYEEESELFFEDLSGKVIQDDVFARLITFPNVLITGHQGFFTRDALQNIAETTLQNICCIRDGRDCDNRVTAAVLRPASGKTSETQGYTNSLVGSGPSGT